MTLQEENVVNGANGNPVKRQEDLDDPRFQIRGNSHYVHVKSNICSGLKAGLGALKRLNGDKKKTLLKLVDKSLELLIIYERLLNEYPEYRKGEIETEKGYYLDISDVGIGNGIENYILESERRLSAPR